MVGSGLLILTAGRAAITPLVRPPTTWWGLLTPASSGLQAGFVALGELCGIAALITGWLALVRSVRTGQVGTRAVGVVAVCWAFPLAIGPPLLSLDAYSYLAQGQLQQAGLNPYQVGPQALHSGPFLAAVDPLWRGTPSPYGPLAMLIARWCAGFGPVGGLVLLHVVAAVALVCAGCCLAALTPAARRPLALALVVANPLVLLHLLAASHWETLIAAGLLGSLLLWQRGLPLAAVSAASATVMVKAPLLLAVVILAALHVAAVPRVRQRLQAGAAVMSAAVLPWLVIAVIQPNPLGFLTTLGSPLAGRTLWCPSTAAAEVIAGVGHLLGTDVDFPVLLLAVQVAAVLTAVGAVAALVCTARRRPAVQTIGVSLLVSALLLPVVYPWYLAWGLVPLIAAGTLGAWSTRLSACAIFTALPGCRALAVFLPAGTAASTAWLTAAVVACLGFAVILRATRPTVTVTV